MRVQPPGTMTLLLGGVALWRYRENQRNYPGFHVAAAAPGCERLLGALALIQMERGREVVVDLMPPDAAILKRANNRQGLARIASFKHWRFRQAATSAPGLAFLIRGDTCNLDVAPQMIARLSEAVVTLAQRTDDFSLGDRDEDLLWFWSPVSATSPRRHERR